MLMLERYERFQTQLKKSSRSECFTQIPFTLKKTQQNLVLIFISGLFSQNGLILSEGAISPEESCRWELFTVQ